MDAILDQLAAGQVRVRAKFARRDNEAGTAPDWSEPKEVVLHVTRRTQSIRRSGRILPAGEIIGVYVLDFDWAEYTERDYCGNGEFLVEEYRMQILEVMHGQENNATPAG